MTGLRWRLGLPSPPVVTATNLRARLTAPRCHRCLRPSDGQFLIALGTWPTECCHECIAHIRSLRISVTPVLAPAEGSTVPSAGAQSDAARAHEPLLAPAGSGATGSG